MTKPFEKPIVTISGRKNLFKSDLHQRILQDLPQEGVDWRRRLGNNSRLVYIDVDFVDFEIDNVERVSERLSRQSISPCEQSKISESANADTTHQENTVTGQPGSTDYLRISSQGSNDKHSIDQEDSNLSTQPSNQREQHHISNAFFTQKLLGRPILHTYWADKADFEAENQKNQFDDWIGQVQASSCTEWAIIIIEDGDFKAQLGTAIFKSKLQSSASQTNVSSTSISSTVQNSSSSFLDRMKKGLSTIFQSDSNSDRWLTLIDQDRLPDVKAQDSYANFLKKLRNLIIASFSKQIELFEEQLRVQREMRGGKDWDLYFYFSMQEELASGFEFLTLFDEALMQYDFLDALFTEYITSINFNHKRDPLCEKWSTCTSWPGLCLDMNCKEFTNLRERIVSKKATLLDFRNYLFARRCDLMFMQNQPWRVAASTSDFIQNSIREHEYLEIVLTPGALTCWSFISALEVLQKCECYSCSSTMENYSYHTVDLWNNARRMLVELGELCHRSPGTNSTHDDEVLIEKLIEGLGPDPHDGISYQANEISPHARLKNALYSDEQYSKHLIEISELTLGTYKHIGRKRHALLVGKELAELYMAQGCFFRAAPFLVDIEKKLMVEQWDILLSDVRKSMKVCNARESESNNEANNGEMMVMGFENL